MKNYYYVNLQDLEGFEPKLTDIKKGQRVIYGITPDYYHIVVPEGRESLERAEILAVVEEIKKEVDKYIVEGISYMDHMLITDAVFLNYYEIPISTLDELPQRRILGAVEKFNFPLKDIVLKQ